MGGLYDAATLRAPQDKLSRFLDSLSTAHGDIRACTILCDASSRSQADRFHFGKMTRVPALDRGTKRTLRAETGMLTLLRTAQEAKSSLAAAPMSSRSRRQVPLLDAAGRALVGSRSGKGGARRQRGAAAGVREKALRHDI